MKHYPLSTPRSRHIGKSIARGSKKAMIDHCFEDPVSRHYIMRKLGRLVNAEVRAMCSDPVKSVLQSKDSDYLKEFKWDHVLDEMKEHAPTLLSILLSSTKTRHPRNNRAATICWVASILFKFRYSRMNVIQKILSLILYAGHCGKQVSAIYTINYVSLCKLNHCSYNRCMRGFRN